MRRPVDNPKNRFHAQHLELLEPPPEVELEVTEVEARSILSKNESPDLGFSYSLNPYQGCFHGCAYCYARPTHQYLGFGAGTDFERKLQVKVNAPNLLRRAFERASWRGEAIVFSGNTDCYQPLEAQYELTRRCLEVCSEFCNPVSVITKGGVIRRDVELLGKLTERAGARVYVTIPFLEESLRKAIEPFAAPLTQRYDVLRALRDAGVPTGVSVSPLIPGLNESDVMGVLEQARDAGASSAFMTLLRLSPEVEQVFFGRLAQLYPGRVERVRRALEEMRGGRLNDARFGDRMAGVGRRWAIVQQVFDKQCARLGLNAHEDARPPQGSSFRRPTRQLALFG
jgi:DNA repair photolyase